MDHEEIKELSSVLKHELNGMLTGVKSGLEVMGMDEHFEDPDNAEELNDIVQSAERIKYLIEDISVIYDTKNESVEKNEILNPELLGEIFKEIQDLEKFTFQSLQFDSSFEKPCNQWVISRIFYWASVLLHQNGVNLNQISLEYKLKDSMWIMGFCSESPFPEMLSSLAQSEDKLNKKSSFIYRLVKNYASSHSAQLKWSEQRFFIIFN